MSSTYTKPDDSQYDEDGKRYVRCPRCKIRFYHKYINHLIKCNNCGYSE